MFLSPEDQTTKIAKVVMDNINTIFPIKVGGKTMTVSNLETTGHAKADPHNYTAISNAKAKDSTYGQDLYGDVELTNTEGKVVDKKRMKIATIPVMTGTGTFVVGGSEYSIDHQLRLKPSIYSRVKQNGEIEAHINPDGFKQMRLSVDPASKKLSVNVNQANINAIPVLRILGINDTEIKNAVGADIYDANIKALGKKSDDEIKRFFKSVNPRAEMPATYQEVATHLSTELKKAKIDPKVTKITLGKAFEHLNGQSLLRGFEKVINIHRGTEEPDDRDALAFKSIHSVDDFIHERLNKQKRQIQFNIENKMRKSENLNQIMHSGHLNQHIFSFFNSAALSEIPSQINPLAIINSFYKTTITGEGGIENAEAIMAESQALHPTHLGYLDPLNTPESKKIGVTLNLTVNTSKKNHDLYTKMTNVKTGKLEEVSSIDGYHHTVALPDQQLKGRVAVIHNGKQIEVDASKVTHQIPSTHSTFTMSSQVLPAMNFNQGNRAGMASRHINQAISLKHREAPLVQVKSPMGRDTVEDYFGKDHYISLHAPEDGKISKITDSHIHLDTKGGEKVIPIFNNYDFQNKSYLHHEIEHLKVGDQFKKGDLIADSNFTKDGTLALGTNLRLAYMPWKGLNFEDGIVVSESAAKKLTSNHMYQDYIEKDDSDIIINKKKFVTMYPSLYTKAQLAKLDDNGLAKPGVKLEPGDPYALVLTKTKGTQEDLMLNRLHKSLVQPYKDASKTWDQIVPGTITKAVYNNKNVKIHGTYESPANTGDKLALRHGNKGVITSIVPDNEMPKTKDGKIVETIMSPLSIITRMSIGQMLENSASKIAEKTGKPYIIENFASDNQLTKLKADLKKHNISDTEELFDPTTGHSYGQVMVGKPLVEKLFKTAKGNISARGTGSYDIDNKPTRSGEDGSKAIDQLTLYGLLSHGARGIISEVSTIKGDGNAQYWQNLQAGLPTPKPQVPFIYKKFESLLNASGINIKNEGSTKILTPLIDSHVKDIAGNNEIQNFRMLDHNLEPITGGLFDKGLTGGSNGQKWSKITLAHPVVNPMFEGAVKTILGLPDSEYKTIIGHEAGHDAIAASLSKINVREQIEQLKKDLPNAPKTKKDKILKKLKVLKSLDHLNLNPKDAYITSVVPVVPPQFRPVFEIPGGHLQTNSLNFLYRDLGLINDSIKQFGATPELSNSLYHSLGAIQGVMKPVVESAESKNIKGALEIITGSGSPKHGLFQQKVLRKQQDLSARASAILNNNLNMDQIAIPEKIAKVIYKPFAMKNLINAGYNHKDASDHIDEFSNVGKKAIQSAMSDRPVLMNRAPSLHKFSIMAFQPTLTKGLSIETPGLIVKPYSLDFDGDTVVLHVPVSEKARVESFGLMPSKNLYNPAGRTLNYTLDQEAIIGLHLLSQDKGGLDKINALLPSNVDKFSGVVNKQHVDAVLASVATKDPDKYNQIATSLKDLGDHYGTQKGFSVSLSDLTNNKKAVDAHFKTALSVMNSTASQKTKLESLHKADASLKASVLDDKSNNFVTMIDSNARGSRNNMAQIAFAPGLMTDHNGHVIMRPVLNSYGQGMPFADYWTTLYSARKGSLDKQLMTAKPGALNKEIVNTSMNIVIAKHDCGTKHGIPMSVSDNHILGRTLVDGRTITNELLTNLRKNNETAVVRSPATCELAHGICQLCYGKVNDNHFAKVGDNVGIASAQSISEPLTQAAMKTFHTGGTASGGGGVFGGFEAVSNFLEAPETFKNRAVMATKDGTVTKITPGAAGGFHVEVDDHSHFITPRSGEVIVSKGDKIKKGDLLNYGIPHPKDTIKLLGEINGLSKITDTLHKIYKDSGIKVDRRNIETVVRGMTGFGSITNEGTHTHYVENDIAPLSAIVSWNNKANQPTKTNVHDSYGKILSEDTGKHKAGTLVNNEIMKDLESRKHKEFLTHEEPIKYERTLIGVSQAPIKTNDFLAHMGYRYLKRGLQEGAVYGYKSDVHGYNPIAPFITGQMEDGHEGKY